MEHRAEQAEQDFSEALSTAQGQGARWFELRAAAGLARHWLGQGRKQAADDLLRPVLDSLTEGLGTFDLQAAKALLALCQAGSR